MTKKILFFAETEYHLMLSVSIVKASFNNKEYFSYIYFRTIESRIDYQIYDSPGLNAKFIAFEMSNRTSIIKDISRLEPSWFFFFKEGDIFMKYLAFRFKRHGAYICLAPDGYKPYGTFNKKHEFLSMLIDTIRDYWKLSIKGIFLHKVFLSRNYRYGCFSLLDYVLLQEPALFDSIRNRTKGVIKRLPEWDPETLRIFGEVFGLMATDLKRMSSVVLYVNQPFWSDSLIELEIKLLKQIRSRFRTFPILIKLHPATPRKTHERYAQLDDVVIINDKRPVELYIARLENSIVLSGWSTALIFNKKENNYYYLFPIYKGLRDKVLQQIDITPFPHIRLIADLKEIKMPTGVRSQA